MESFQPQAETRPVQVPDFMPGSTQMNWESPAQPATTPVPQQQDTSYMDQMFAQDKATNWKAAPPVEVAPEQTSFGDSAWNMVKGLGKAAVAAPQAIYDWGE